MLARSFRLVTARLLPRPGRCKLALLVGTLILAGCGGSGEAKAQWQAVSAHSLRFRAPKGWEVTVAPDRVIARDGESFVQVATFPLVHAYTDSLFERVQPELATRMADVAAQAHGVVSSHRIVEVGGSRAHSYEVTIGRRVDRYTFVLRGKREFLLVCSADSDVCDELAASFVVA
jgi:hypothetical protein